MKKLLNFTIFFNLFFIFCSFFVCIFAPPPIKTPINKSSASDITASELELQEYQNLEHGVYANTSPEDAEIETKQTDTPKNQNYTIVIDAGHGGPDPGSIGYKTKVLEADINLKISYLLKDKLEKAGITVVMTRTSTEALAEGRGKSFKKRDMELRKEIIKKVRPNMVISLHQNSFTNHTLRGAQVFYDKTSEISKQIADMIQTEFLKTIEHSNKSISPGNYYMLKCTAAPSVIVECGFLSHPEEEQLLQTEEHQNKITTAIAKGILNFISTIK